jgi:hypothetical protein
MTELHTEFNSGILGVLSIGIPSEIYHPLRGIQRCLVKMR